MKKFSKIALMFLVLTLTVSMFTGCGQTKSPSTEPTATPVVEKLVMGTNAEFPPFEYIEEGGKVDGKFSGIDVEIAMEIAKSEGKTLTVDNMEFESLLVALANGKVDFVAAGMTVKPERAEKVDFSDTYYTATQAIIVKADSDIKSAADLKNKKVAVIVGYTGDSICTDDLKLTNITRLKRGVDAVMELKNGKVDAVVIDIFPAQNFVKQNSDLKVVEDNKAFEKEEYAIAVKKGNTELLNKINTVIKQIKENNTLEKIVANNDKAE